MSMLHSLGSRGNEATTSGAVDTPSYDPNNPSHTTQRQSSIPWTNPLGTGSHSLGSNLTGTPKVRVEAASMMNFNPNHLPLPTESPPVTPMMMTRGNRAASVSSVPLNQMTTSQRLPTAETGSPMFVRRLSRSGSLSLGLERRLSRSGSLSMAHGRRLSRQLSTRVAEADAQAVRQTIITNSVQEAQNVRGSRIAIIFLSVCFIPQIIGGSIAAGLFWDSDAKYCSSFQNWTIAVIVQTFLSLVVDWFAFWKGFLDAHPDEQGPNAWIQKMKQLVDMSGLIIFLLGNLQLFGDSAKPCKAENEEMFYLSTTLLILSYVRLFFPCLLILMLLPLACFCLPCLIAILRRLQDPSKAKGASQEAIDAIETRNYVNDMFPEEDCACCICLADYEEGQELRLLPCQHHFCKECVDQWLLVNPVCPLCRTSILPQNDAAGVAAGTDDAAAGAAPGQTYMPPFRRADSQGERAPQDIAIFMPPLQRSIAIASGEMSGQPAGAGQAGTTPLASSPLFQIVEEESVTPPPTPPPVLSSAASSQSNNTDEGSQSGQVALDSAERGQRQVSGSPTGTEGQFF